ncbi:MAG: hypothetical protein AAGC53_13900 [Actinomycetota bacterium]
MARTDPTASRDAAALLRFVVALRLVVVLRFALVFFWTVAFFFGADGFFLLDAVDDVRFLAAFVDAVGLRC